MRPGYKVHNLQNSSLKKNGKIISVLGIQIYINSLDIFMKLCGRRKLVKDAFVLKKRRFYEIIRSFFKMSQWRRMFCTQRIHIEHSCFNVSELRSIYHIWLMPALLLVSKETSHLLRCRQPHISWHVGKDHPFARIPRFLQLREVETSLKGRTRKYFAKQIYKFLS